MLNVGRLAVKIAGREAGKKCVIVNVIDDKFVLIDGNVKRKRCSILHLEPLNDTVDIKDGAPHDEITAAFKKLKILSLKSKVRRKAAVQKPVTIIAKAKKSKSDK